MHLVREQASTGPDPEQVAMSLIDRLIEEAASAQRANREKDARIAELEKELDELEARYDALKAIV